MTKLQVLCQKLFVKTYLLDISFSNALSLLLLKCHGLIFNG